MTSLATEEKIKLDPAELDGLDYLFVAPSSSVHRIQEAQTTIYHALWELTLAALGEGG